MAQNERFPGTLDQLELQGPSSDAMRRSGIARAARGSRIEVLKAEGGFLHPQSDRVALGEWLEGDWRQTKSLRRLTNLGLKARSGQTGRTFVDFPQRTHEPVGRVTWRLVS